MAIILSDKLRRRLEELAEKDRVAQLLLDPDATHARSMNHLSIRKDGQFAFTPRGKPLVYKEDGVWSKEGRQEARPGRVVRKVFVPDVNQLVLDREVELFVGRMAGDFLEGDMELVSGDEIHYWYQADNNHDKSGRLNSSCMQSATKQRLRIYTGNPETVHLLILRDGTKIRARSLVWDTSHGRTMDTIYGNTDATNKFLAYAKQQEWNARYNYSTTRYDWDYAFYTHENASLDQERLTVPLANWDFCSLPSIDTFRYLEDGVCVANKGPNTWRYPDHCGGEEDYEDDENDYEDDDYHPDDDYDL